MKAFLFLLLGLCAMSVSYAGETGCDGKAVDLLILGDSQTGADWATAYFGNFLQKCLKTHPTGLSFASYARGGTSPDHWTTSPGLDKINTIFRDNDRNHLNLGGSDLPVCKKRLKSLLEIHRPKKVLLFFGDNLITNSPDEIKLEYRKMIKVVKDYGISKADCLLLTPTYEMAVADHRNVKAKTFENTSKVIKAVTEESQNDCTVLSGLEIMKESASLSDLKLKRVAVEGTAGCFGAAANDNIHICGEAARDFANRVCTKIQN
jgi:hypothetical protein